MSFEITVKRDGEEIAIARGKTLVDVMNRLLLMFDLNHAAVLRRLKRRILKDE